MKVLGIDTSSLSTSIAVIEDDKLICEYSINTKKTHSQKLMLMLENMLQISDININEIDLIAVCEGPGSFTGLRIGMSTAKAISHVRNIPIVTVDALSILAQNVEVTDKKICAILDAQRTDVYTSKFEYKNNKLEKITEIEVKDIDEVLNSIDENYIIVGEATYKYLDKIKEFNLSTPKNRINSASSLCFIGLNKFMENKDIKNSQTANLNYIRKSQAEVEYEAKQNKNSK